MNLTNKNYASKVPVRALKLPPCFTKKDTELIDLVLDRRTLYLCVSITKITVAFSYPEGGASYDMWEGPQTLM